MGVSPPLMKKLQFNHCAWKFRCHRKAKLFQYKLQPKHQAILQLHPVMLRQQHLSRIPDMVVLSTFYVSLAKEITNPPYVSFHFISHKSLPTFLQLDASGHRPRYCPLAPPAGQGGTLHVNFPYQETIVTH